MRTPNQIRARELSRMHPEDRKLAKTILPKPNLATWSMPRTTPVRAGGEALVADAAVLSAIGALKLLKALKALPPVRTRKVAGLDA